jgi:hypothetical protein
VDNVHYLVNEKLLNFIFEPFGKIITICIYKNGTFPGKALIEFLHPISTERAVADMQNFFVGLFLVF